MTKYVPSERVLAAIAQSLDYQAQIREHQDAIDALVIAAQIPASILIEEVGRAMIAAGAKSKTLGDHVYHLAAETHTYCVDCKNEIWLCECEVIRRMHGQVTYRAWLTGKNEKPESEAAA